MNVIDVVSLSHDAYNSEHENTKVQTTEFRFRTYLWQKFHKNSSTTF